MAFGLATLGLQQVVADISAGDVEVRADAFQHAGPQEEVLAHIVVGHLDTAEGLDAVDAGEQHEQQQTAESGHQRESTVHGLPTIMIARTPQREMRRLDRAATSYPNPVSGSKADREMDGRRRAHGGRRPAALYIGGTD